METKKKHELFDLFMQKENGIHEETHYQIVLGFEP